MPPAVRPWRGGKEPPQADKKRCPEKFGCQQEGKKEEKEHHDRQEGKGGQEGPGAKTHSGMGSQEWPRSRVRGQERLLPGCRIYFFFFFFFARRRLGSCCLQLPGKFNWQLGLQLGSFFPPACRKWALEGSERERPGASERARGERASERAGPRKEEKVQEGGGGRCSGGRGTGEGAGMLALGSPAPRSPRPAVWRRTGAAGVPLAGARGQPPRGMHPTGAQRLGGLGTLGTDHRARRGAGLAGGAARALPASPAPSPAWLLPLVAERRRPRARRHWAQGWPEPEHSPSYRS